MGIKRRDLLARSPSLAETFEMREAERNAKLEKEIEEKAVLESFKPIDSHVIALEARRKQEEYPEWAKPYNERY